MPTLKGPAVFCCLLVTLFVVGVSQFLLARPQSQQSQDSLRVFLRGYLENLSSGEDRTTQYAAVATDLNGDGTKEVVVYVTGRSWCGSGGCTMLVIAPTESSYRVIARVPLVRLPIRMLTSRSNGWRDLGVWVEGGGVRPGHEALLPYDGVSYATNPSLPPARPLTKQVAGEVLLKSGTEGTKLY